MTSRRSPVHRSKRTEKTGRVSSRPGPPARSGLAGPCASLRRTPRPPAGGRRPAGEGAVNDACAVASASKDGTFGGKPEHLRAKEISA